MTGVAGGVAAFILAGGKSTRMGADKAFLTLGGSSLLARSLAVAGAVADEVCIVGEARKFQAFAPVVEDVFRGCGPLAGIHAALRASHMELNLILAVDLPFVTPELLRFLFAQARESPAMVTAVRARGGWQPLCAVYRGEFAEVAEKALREGRYRIDTLFDSQRMLEISEDQLKTTGLSADIFRNLNTPEELADAESRKLAEEEQELRARS